MSSVDNGPFAQFIQLDRFEHDPKLKTWVAYVARREIVDDDFFRGRIEPLVLVDNDETDGGRQKKAVKRRLTPETFRE